MFQKEGKFNNECYQTTLPQHGLTAKALKKKSSCCKINFAML
jgi:hypothetical protein